MGPFSTLSGWSIGVRMWGQDDQDAACAAGNHVRVWVFTTDQGPDQVAASKLLQRDVAESVTDIVIAQWCLAHVFHLTVKFQVQQLVVPWQVLRFARKGCQLVEESRNPEEER